MKTSVITAATVEELRQGSTSGFEQIFLFYYPRVRKFIELFTRERHFSGMRAGEIFVAVWNRRGEMTSQEKFQRIVYELTRQAVLDGATGKIAPQAESRDDMDPVDEAKMLVDMLVSAMPEKQQLIYRMGQVEGQDTASIARSMNTSKRKVEKQLDNAVKEVRSVLSVFVGLLT